MDLDGRICTCQVFATKRFYKILLGKTSSVRTFLTRLLYLAMFVVLNWTRTTSADGQCRKVSHRGTTKLQTLQLCHPQRDHDVDVRAYFTNVMRATPAHQDCLMADDRHFWTNHMTKYCSKFSDSLVDERFNDDNDATTVALNVLMRYRRGVRCDTSRLNLRCTYKPLVKSSANDM